jgi:hypothetical protein
VSIHLPGTPTCRTADRMTFHLFAAPRASPPPPPVTPTRITNLDAQPTDSETTLVAGGSVNITGRSVLLHALQCVSTDSVHGPLQHTHCNSQLRVLVGSSCGTK